MGAAVRDAGFGMTRAKHHAAGQHDRWGRARTLNFWNGDGDIGRFNQEFDIAKAQGLASSKDGLLDGLTIEKCAVGRIAITQQDSFGSQGDVAVVRGNGGVVDREVVCRIAPKAIKSKI